MSQEEIDRILNADFSDIDGAIEAKISSIDQMASKLNQRSNFLAQFQSLLQNQLGNGTIIDQKEQKEREEIVEIVQKVENIETIEQTHEFTQTNLVPLIKQKKRCLCSSIVERIIFDLQEYKVHFLCLKQEISNEIKHYRSIVTKHISSGVKIFFQQQKQTYQQIIDDLRIRLTTIQSQRIKKQSQITLLQQISFNKINEESTEAFNITKRLIEYDSQAKQPRKERREEAKDKIPFSIEKNVNKQQMQDSFVNGLYVKEEVIVRNDQNRRKIQYDLPSVRPLTVGIPPVKNGFGVLKQGNYAIYRGQWRNGRFQGSGKLMWDGYSYEGGFKNGLFEGHGTLISKGIKFMGKFISNKACGEGTLFFPQGQIMGLWSQNSCLRLI